MSTSIANFICCLPADAYRLWPSYRAVGTSVQLVISSKL
jgi:hypothetical protein